MTYGTVPRCRPSRVGRTVFAFLCLALVMRFMAFLGTGAEHNVLILGVFSCDRWGDRQLDFPIESWAFFNIGLRNAGSAQSEVSIYLAVLDDSNVPVGLDQLNTTIPPDAHTRYHLRIFIPKWARVGYATAHASVFEAGKLVDEASTEFHIVPADLVPPTVHLLSPENTTYRTPSVPLIFTVDETTFWTGYSVNQDPPVSMMGNTTLAGLCNGSYSLQVYGNDSSGNLGSSELVNFTVSIVHDVAVLSVECAQTDRYFGEVVNITITVRNKGTVAETFAVATFANATMIDEETVTLSSETSVVITFSWNTTTSSLGTYTISAHASSVQGEYNTTDNLLWADSQVCITVQGDVDRDFDVDIDDIVLMSGAYASKEGEPKYLANCDVDRDGDVDIYDIIIATVNYGKF